MLYGEVLVCDTVMYIQYKPPMLMLEGMLDYNNIIIGERRSRDVSEDGQVVRE